MAEKRPRSQSEAVDFRTAPANRSSMQPASPAKAVDAASKPQPAADKDEFARRLGFTSYLDLFEASTPAGTAEGKNWFITALSGGRWVVWNDENLTASDSFASLEDARRHLPASLPQGQ